MYLERNQSIAKTSKLNALIFTRGLFSVKILKTEKYKLQFYYRKIGYRDVGDKSILMTKIAKSVTHIFKLSPKHFLSNIHHQHRCSRKSAEYLSMVLTVLGYFSKTYLNKPGQFETNYTRTSSVHRCRSWLLSN